MKLYLWAILATISLMVLSCKKADSSGGSNGQQQPVVGLPDVPLAQTNSGGPNPENPTAEPTVTIEDKRLPVKNVGREGVSSCWAACGEMLMDFIGPVEARQCVQAQKLRGLTESDCCKTNGRLRAASSCDGAGYPDFDGWGFDFTGSSTPLSWDDVVKEIKANRPFGFAWIPNNSAVEHMMVVFGYKVSGTNRQLLVLDPADFISGDPPEPADERPIYYSDYEVQSVTNFYGIKLRSTPP